MLAAAVGCADAGAPPGPSFDRDNAATADPCADSTTPQTRCAALFAKAKCPDAGHQTLALSAPAADLTVCLCVEDDGRLVTQPSELTLTYLVDQAGLPRVYPNHPLLKLVMTFRNVSPNDYGVVVEVDNASRSLSASPPPQPVLAGNKMPLQFGPIAGAETPAAALSLADVYRGAWRLTPVRLNKWHEAVVLPMNFVFSSAASPNNASPLEQRALKREEKTWFSCSTAIDPARFCPAESAAMIRVGDPAPPFEAPDSAGNLVRLADYHGKKNVVLFFYPKSFTPGCTREVCSFRDAYDELTATDTVLLGVSLDPMDLQQRFVQQFALPFTLLSDTDRRLSRAYGAIGFLGGVLGVARRITFVIDKQGIVRGAFRHELAVGRHVDDVRATLQALT